MNKTVIPKHYKEFMKSNTEGICPFCGIHTIKENNHKYREVYDHYIPKAIYPFVSLNFKNLAPMCQECNSTYKGTKVPIEDDNKKRKLAFYPY
ncbi:MAG: hypothetical protein DRJ09_06835 [Bacteroidetes bacterium]|nr:MAG: hypothetical protein DRJ09_06835 [Bacteroidota bacterium]